MAGNDCDSDTWLTYYLLLIQPTDDVTFRDYLFLKTERIDVIIGVIDIVIRIDYLVMADVLWLTLYRVIVYC